MDYIIFKADGSINKGMAINPSLKRYIQQGNDQVDKIFIGYPDALGTDYCQAVFTLPNHTTNTELGTFYEQFPYEADDPFAIMENPNWMDDYHGLVISGWVITLTEDQTRYNGILTVAVRVVRQSSILVNYPFNLVINETGVRPDTDTGVTIEQLDSYLLNLQLNTQALVESTFRENVDGSLSFDSENPVQNKVVSYNLAQKVDKVSEPGNKKVYGINASGEQTTYTVGDSGSNIPQRDANGQIKVPSVPSAGTDAASKDFVTSTVAAAQTGQYVEVDTTTYPTLEDFLATTGQANKMYLYPLDTSDPSEGYYNYIWSNNAWLLLGTTSIDLSEYVTRSEANNNYVSMTGNQTVPGVKNFTAGLVGPYVGCMLDGIVYTAFSQNSTDITAYHKIKPAGPNSFDLGALNSTWKDLYLGGKINPNSFGFGLTLPSTNGRYSDLKIATEDDITNVMEVAEGKCKTFVLSYADTINSIKTAIQNSTVGSLHYKKYYAYNTTTEEWEDKTEDLLSGAYTPTGLIQNNIFNSQNNYVDNNYGYIVVRSTGWTTNTVIDFYELRYGNPLVKVGDIFLVIETDVPDRWCADNNAARFYMMETSKVDLDAYYSKSANLIPTAPGFDIGDSTHTYNQVWASYIQNLTQLYLGVNGLSIVKLNYTSGSDSYSVELGSNKSSIRLTSKEARPTYQYYTTDAISELHTLPVDNDVYSTLGVDPYDSTAQYAVGDLVAYLYKVYRCTTAISVPEDFDSDHWTEVLLAPLAYDAVTKSGAQEIPGVKTFTNGFRLGNNFLITEEVGGHRTIFTISGGPLNHEEAVFGLNISNSQTLLMTPVPLDSSGTWDIGASNRKWRDIYIARYLTDGTNQVQISEISKTKLYKHTIPLPNGYVGSLIAITKDNTSYTNFSDSADGLAQRTDLLSKAVSIRISISGATSQGNNCPVYDFGYSMGYIGNNGAATVNFDNYVFVDTIDEL